MPAKWFICPDGEQIEMNSCIEKGCRIATEFPAGRCLSRRTLTLISEQRPWNGTPSTTQLLKCTREAYLEITQDYAIDPQDELWRVHGSRAHFALEQYNDNALSEERLYDERSSGAFDYYDDGTLYDTKTWGSYKIMKALGMYQVEVETGEILKSGPNKGKPKTKKEWRTDGKPDLFDQEMQLNDYRMKLEAAGFPVNEMLIEALARDGSTWIAGSRGVQKNGILIPVRRLPDDEVKAYFGTKNAALMSALNNYSLPPCGNEQETWKGRKCEKYCRVSDYCRAAQQRKEAGLNGTDHSIEHH